MSRAASKASIVIDAPILEVFDFVADPRHLPEWVPFYSATSGYPYERARRGDYFEATLSIFPPVLNRFSGVREWMGALWAPKIRVYFDDVVLGRRIAYRSNDVGWTTICDFEPAGGRTVLTVTNSSWSFQGMAMDYWFGPYRAVLVDGLLRILEGLKERLEGRAVEQPPDIFFSYRRADSRYVGGRIFDALTSEFGRGTVFRDNESLLAGGSWRGDIAQAIRGCRVVVAHIGDDWEKELVRRRNSADGLRDELELALKDSKAHVIPVVTSKRDALTTHDRFMEIEAALEDLGESSSIRQKFTAGLQALRLREDPDFRSDLEQLMRAVWNQFRADASDVPGSLSIA
jgi:hypothetical protein